MNIQKFLLEKINLSLKKTKITNTFHIQLQQTTKTQFGNYQINGIMKIAKTINTSPKKLAQNIINSLELHNIAKKIEIANNQFINIFLEPQWIEKQINTILSSSHLGVTPIKKKQTIIIDYSSPNIAKEMHVGHLRSTIIGDAIARILSFIGHNVIRANHIGDWGTQFGMLIAYLKKNKHDIKSHKNISLHTIEQYYQAAKRIYDTNPIFAQYARNCLVKLQQGDSDYRKIWKNLVNISIKHNKHIYKQLNISLKDSDIMGESIYNNMLPDIVNDLKNKGLATDNNGAIVVFLNEFKNKQGQPMGVIIKKQDGGYLYTTTDIACIKYRCEVLKANKIIYYTDSRQNQHLKQVCLIAQKANYIPKSVSFEHHMFGMILDINGKPFKSRLGKTIKIQTLLNEALQRAQNLISSKHSNIKNKKIKYLAHIISVSAIKYADLSKNRTTNYIFDWNQILNFEGNTAPYIQYAYTRIISILKKNKKYTQSLNTKIYLQTQEEISLAICLLQFEEIIVLVANKGTPHILCNYLYKTALLFSSFYENHSILNTKHIPLKQSRLKLSLLTASILKKGLNLLGITTTKEM